MNEIDFPQQSCMVSLIQGGLGNQLFQITSSIALGEHLGPKASWEYDIGWYKRQTRKAHEIVYEELISAIAQKKIVHENSNTRHSYHHRKIDKLLTSKIEWSGVICENIHAVVEARLNKRDRRLLLNETLLDGDYILKPVVVEYMSRLKAAITFSPITVDWIKELSQKPLCGIHVRRGDYLTDASFLPKMTYYHQAMGIIQSTIPSVVFIVHSDDLEWCKQQSCFQRGDVIFLDNQLCNNALIELFLLSKVSAYITANSTYSWWASACARIFNPDYRFSIMPYQWFGSDNHNLTKSLIRSDSICLRSW